MPNTALIDAGFLIALFRAADRHHGSAVALLQGPLRQSRTVLVTVLPVLVEACFFLDARGKAALLEWVRRGAVRLHPVTTADLDAIIRIVQRYADRDIDFTDACLIWLGSSLTVDQVLTVDRKDFDIYRLEDGRPFRRLWLP